MESVHGNIMSNHPIKSSLDGLPKQFVASMRTLFDIMDENNTGQIRFGDIETRWREDNSGTAKKLPKGVIECLKKVTPTNGMLTFERFCAGLKICLLRNRNEFHNSSGTGNGKPPLPIGNHLGNAPKKVVPSQTVSPTVTRPFLSSLDSSVSDDKEDDRSHRGATLGNHRTSYITNVPIASERQQGFQQRVHHPVVTNSDSRDIHHRSHSNSSAVTTATVKPNISFQHRAVSMPLLGDRHLKTNKGNIGFGDDTYHETADLVHEPSDGSVPGQRTELRSYRSELKITSSCQSHSRSGPETASTVASHENGTNSVNRDSQAANEYGNSVYQGSSMNHARNRRGIMTVLHNWHMGMLNEAASGEPRTRLQTTNIRTNVSAIRQRSSNTQPTRLDDLGGGVASDGDIGALHSSDPANRGHRKGHPRRREPRRHTLANGIDYNMLKRMKQLEQEKDVLLQGLEAVDKARTWYLKQIVSVQEKMKYIGQSNGHVEYSTEAHQERLNFQMAQIFEVNQHLAALVESTERGFPLHMNLAVRQPAAYFKKSQQIVASQQDQELAVHHLKELNHLLSEEVSKKSERITQLEKEKAALVRELFQARAISRRDSDDVTLM